MTEEEEKFLSQFKEGEYSVLSLMVMNKDIHNFIEHLKAANITVAILPNVQANLDFIDPDKTGTPQ